MFDSFMQMGMGAAMFLSVAAAGLTILGVALIVAKGRRQARDLEYAERVKTGEHSVPARARR